MFIRFMLQDCIIPTKGSTLFYLLIDGGYIYTADLLRLLALQCVKLNKNHGGHMWPLNTIMSCHRVFLVAKFLGCFRLYDKQPGNAYTRTAKRERGEGVAPRR